MSARRSLAALALLVGLTLGPLGGVVPGTPAALGAPGGALTHAETQEPGPSPSPPPALGLQDEPSLATQLLREADSVRGLLAGGGIALLLLILTVGGLGYLGVARLIRAMGRSGYAMHRRLATLRVLLVSLIVVWGASVLVRQLLLRAPLLTLILLVLFTGGALLGLASRLQQASAGIAMVLRGRIREGDRLVVGAVAGTVEHAGLLQIQLACADGSTVYLPTSALASQPVVISTPSRAQPVELPWPLEVPLDEAERARLLGIVTLCPYRVPGTPLSLTMADDGSHRVTVRFQAWSAPAAERAGLWLSRSLRARS
ncbi:MAG: mechanosensitive ion channel domain-containing protein [Pseudomonadota bacterium]